QEKSALDPEHFLDLKLKTIDRTYKNHNISRFVFELPDGGAALLAVSMCPWTRIIWPCVHYGAYTPISSPDREGELVLLIEKYEDGVVSKYVHERLKGPIVKFPYKANEFEDVALIGGGSGITPLYQLLNHALNDPANRTRFTLLYANVSEADILLRDELAALQRAHPQTFKVVHTLDKPPAAGWSGASGYVSRELVQAHVPPSDKGDKIKVFICGPPGQVNAVAGKKDGMKQGEIGAVLKELGYTEEQVFKF
ncbi:hypothetical protein BJV77DRAFT_952340, partial [Russula vinacea]